jgi:hypothetical protein
VSASGGYAVFLTDLLKTADVFDEQSKVFETIMPDGGPACPDGGAADINHAIQGAAEMLGSLHTQLATVMSQHATLLEAAHTRYSRAENQLSKLAYAITNPDKI